MISLRQLFRSMQFQLIFWSVLSLLLLAVIAGGYGFWYSYKELNEFQDDSLESMSALIVQTIVIAAADNSPLLKSNIHFETDDEEGSITVDIINTAIDAPIIYQSSHDIDTNNDNLDNDEKSTAKKKSKDKKDKESEDFDTLTLEDLPTIPVGISTKVIDDDTWRIYRSDSADNVVIVRQRTEFQDELAQSSALQSFLPLIIGMGFLTLLLPFIMWRMLKPVRQLRREIDQRRENDLKPLPIDNLPTELLPFAQSLNQLLALVKTSIERQQRFIADAAHELRSPLTAISLQLQRLQRVTDDDVMVRGLDKLAIRLKRNQLLVEQLLTLARADSIRGKVNANTDDSIDTARMPVSVKAIIEQVIGLLIPIIDNKNIVLNVHLSADEQLHIDETSLLLVVKNLIQNAIVYTPSGGEVSIKLFNFQQNLKTLSSSIHTDFGSQVINSGRISNSSKEFNERLVLQIIDSGKGIHPDNYINAFEPFVRLSETSSHLDNESAGNNSSRSDSVPTKNTEVEDIKGTGLGLSIVKSICEQSGIDVFMKAAYLTALGDNEHRGLCVTLVFN